MRSSTLCSALALLLLYCADVPDQMLGANVVEAWDFKDVLAERVRTLGARMAAAATPTTFDDHAGAFEAANQCMYCHQE